MNKLLILATALATPLPAAGADPPLPLKAPVPSAPLKDWVANNDYSGAALRDGAPSGPVNLALTVAPEGGVIHCAVERSSGSRSVDTRTCEIFQQRGRFQPALDGAGKPVTGVFRLVAAFGSADGAPLPLGEMTVGVPTLPRGLADPSYVDIAASIDETGRVDGCVLGQLLDWSGQPVADRIDPGKLLGAAACAEALKSLKLEPAKNPAGQPVRSVQAATVRFNLDAAAPAAQVAGPGNDIIVSGRQPEAKVTPQSGGDPFVDFMSVGNEVALLQTRSGQWYRATFQPYCIGNSSLMKQSKDKAQVDVEAGLLDSLPRDLRRALQGETQAMFIPDPMMDRNGDGIITRAEWTSSPSAPAIQLFDSLDVDMDNELAPEEIQPGLSKRLPPGMQIQEGLAFQPRPDGGFDRRGGVVAMTIDNQDIVHINRCQIRNLVESVPPAKRK